MQQNDNEWIFGIHAIENALKKNHDHLVQILVAQGTSNKRLLRLIRSAEDLNITLHYKSPESLDQQVKDKHQGVIAQLQTVSYKTEQQLKADVQQWDKPLLLVLDNIEDPRNLGACLRSADAAGVTAVIMTKNKSAPITAITRKTAAGAVDNLAIYQVSNLARALDIIKQAGIWVYGTDCTEESKSIYATDLNGAAALVMGNEGKGMRHLVKQSCDQLIHIPLAGSVQSLNVSVATGISLFEALRQRTS